MMLFDGGDALGALLDRLASGDAASRKVALAELADLGDLAAVPEIVGCLSHSDPGLREAAVAALEAFEDAEAVAALAGALEDPSPADERVIAIRGSTHRARPRRQRLLLMDVLHLLIACRRSRRSGGT